MPTSRDNRERVLRLPLLRDEPHPCPYLPDRTAQDQFTFFTDLEPSLYQQMMDAGFRRSGGMVYRTACPDCRECIPIRIPVDRFSPSRSQTRAWKRNADVGVEFATPCLTDEKWEIYKRYVIHQHDYGGEPDRDSVARFLYESPTRTEEMTFRVEGRIAGVGIVDVTPRCISSVYFYFHPDFARRSLGIFSALYEIEECRRRGRPYWYAGYFVRQCPRMNYKAAFRPYELLGPDGNWCEA